MAAPMKTTRLEAFTDGVLAIVLTIMVLELKVPHNPEFSALVQLAPVFLSYALSFIYVGIYWNNHHHLLHVAKTVSGATLWANLHLLFWLSLIPFVTAWAGENHFESLPVASYAFILFMAANAYYILTRTLVTTHGKDSEIARALGEDWKGKISTLMCAVAIPIAFWTVHVSLGLLVGVAAIWFIPDRRVEEVVEEKVPKKN